MNVLSRFCCYTFGSQVFFRLFRA